MIEIFRYQTEDGKEPLTEWLQSLRDKQAQAKFRMRLKRLESGNFGDCDLWVKAYRNYENILVRVIEFILDVMGRRL